MYSIITICIKQNKKITEIGTESVFFSNFYLFFIYCLLFGKDRSIHSKRSDQMTVNSRRRNFGYCWVLQLLSILSLFIHMIEFDFEWKVCIVKKKVWKRKNKMQL